MRIEEFAQVFGAMVRKAREDRMWTQADMAKRLGKVLGKDVSALAVSRIEAAQRPVPLPEVAALAQLLNLELDPLLNPAPVRGTRAQLVQQTESLRGQLDELHLKEVRLMAGYASARQQLEQVRSRKDALERELQALERATRKDADGEQEHQEEAER